MRLTRREFTGAAIAAAAAAAIPVRLLAGLRAGTFFEWKKLSDGVWAGLGGGGNALLVASRGHAALIDCKNFGLGPTLRREAIEQAGALAAVVNTHHHGDHTGGNHAFTRDTPLYAHANGKPRVVDSFARTVTQITGAGDQARDGMISRYQDQAHDKAAGEAIAADIRGLFAESSNLKADHFAPTELVTDEREVRVGDFTIVLRHVGPAHTDNDLIVRIPQLNLIHAGDMCFNRLHPFIDMNAGATTLGWIANCDAMLALCDAGTTVVPGHGEIGARAALEGQKRYFQILREKMAEAHKKGMSRDEAVAMKIDEFADFGFPQMQARSFGAVYDEMGAN